MNLVTNGIAGDIVRRVGLQLLENFALGFLGQTIFLFVALLIMVKVQKLNCNPFALIFSAALACALEYIPYVGIELSIIALLLCITKAIGARTFTDAIFTTGISYALTFCFNLYVLSMLMGNLRHPTLVRARTAGPVASTQASGTNFSHGSNAMATATLTEPSATNPADDPTAISSVHRGRQAPPVAVGTNSPFAGKMASEVASQFNIKGISKGAVLTIAMIGNGTHTYDIVAGDNFQMQTSSGKANAVCDSVDENRVVLEVEGVLVTIAHK